MCTPKSVPMTTDQSSALPNRNQPQRNDMAVFKRTQPSDIIPNSTEEMTERAGSLRQSRNPTTRAPSRSPCQKDASQLRCRYLHALGIHGSNPKPGLKRPTPSRPSPAALKEPLKHDYGKDEGSMTTSTSSSTLSSHLSSETESSPERTRTRRVSFADTVKVHQIPLRSEYSSRIRKCLWSDRTEVQESAQRNAVEFASENWDWRQATEEQDMYWFQGNLIHPIHCVQRYNLQRQFFLVMSAQCSH